MISRKYDLKLTPDLVYLIEALKVEGSWCLGNSSFCIQNKNLPFLEKIQCIVRKLGMNVSKRILIKIKPTQDFIKEDITLLNNNMPLRFHLEKSPFDGSKKVVTSLSYKQNYKLILKVRDKTYGFVTKVLKEEIRVRSRLEGWAYGEVRFASIEMLKFLLSYVGNKKKFRVEPFLFNADKEYVASAFSALIDSEGSIDHSGLHRGIRVRMRTEHYLYDWKTLLNKFDIYARYTITQKRNYKEYELCINGWEDFDRLKKLGLILYQSKKSKKLGDIFTSYKINQVSRNTAYNFYAKKLGEFNNPVTAKYLAQKLKKSKRNVSHYLMKLMRKDLIKVYKSPMIYLYTTK